MNKLRRDRAGWRWFMLIVFAVLAALGLLLSVMQGSAAITRRTSSAACGSPVGGRRIRSSGTSACPGP